MRFQDYDTSSKTWAHIHEYLSSSIAAHEIVTISRQLANEYRYSVWRAGFYGYRR